MMLHLATVVPLVLIVFCSWNLAQQNVLGKEPFARTIGLTYGVMALGAIGWLFGQHLPFEGVGVPIFLIGLAMNLLLISFRLSKLYPHA